MAVVPRVASSPSRGRDVPSAAPDEAIVDVEAAEPASGVAEDEAGAEEAKGQAVAGKRMDADEDVLPTVQSILCRVDALGSRLENAMRQPADDAGDNEDTQAGKSWAASQRKFNREYTLVVEKVKVLKEMSLRCDLNQSFSAKKNREGRKLEKQIRKLRRSIVLKDLPLLRKIANGQGSLFGPQHDIPQADLERRIDMIVQLRAWVDEKAEPYRNEDSDDEQLPVDVTVDASNGDAGITAAASSTMPSRFASTGRQGEELSDAERGVSRTGQTAANPTETEAADSVIGRWQYEASRMHNYANSEVSEGSSWAVPEDSELHETFDESNPTAQMLHLQQMRRIAAQKERREAMKRRHDLRNSKGGSVDFGKPGCSGGGGPYAPSQGEYPEAPPSEASTAAEPSEQQPEGRPAGVAQGSSSRIGTPDTQTGPSKARPATPAGAVRSSPQYVNDSYAGSDYDSPASTSRSHHFSNLGPHQFPTPGRPGGNDEVPGGGSGRSEAYTDATPHQTPREVQQRIEEVIAAEAAQREAALQNARMESQRMRDVLKKKSEAKVQRQAAMWDDTDSMAPEVKECMAKLQGLKDDPQAFVDMLYTDYPPKDGRTKYDRGNLKKTIQRAISHYHPDRQDEELHGAAWVSVCDEICKELTRIYVKL